MRIRWILGLMLIVGVAVELAIICYGSLPKQSPGGPPPISDQYKLIRDNVRKPPVALDLPGINNPKLIAGEKAGLQDDDIVIGVRVNGESRAYLRSAFDGGPDRHIVNDKLGSVAVSVVHCDRNRITRVFTSDKSDGPLNIRCGGWTGKELALLVDDQEFAQSSREIPLQNVDYVETTWKDWRKAQPATLVYDGQILN